MPVNPKSKLNLRPFKKGEPNPKQYRGGRVATRQDLIKAIEGAANMKLFDDRGKPMKLDGEEMTRLSAVIRTAFSGRSAQDRRFLIWLLEFWLGKTPEKLDISNTDGTLKNIITITHNDNKS